MMVATKITISTLFLPCTMIYRFKVWFEDQEDIIRWIDVKPAHTLLQFHQIIQESIGFDGKELASFFVSDDRWRRLKEVQLDASANAVNSGDVVYKSQMIGELYVSDYIALWTLYCELVTIAETDAKKTYPSIYRSEGKAPRQKEDGKFKMLDDDEFDALAEKILAAKNAKALLIDHEEELLDEDDDFEDEDDDDEDDNNDEFGFGEFQDGLDADDLK